MSNDAPKSGNQNYREVTITASFRRLISFNESGPDYTIVKEIKAKGFESMFQAQQYFAQKVGLVTFELGRPVWLSNLVGDNGDFVCEAVPTYWANGVVVLED